jgi:integrase
MQGIKGLGRVYRRPKTRLWWCAFQHRGTEVRESTGTHKRRDAVRYLQARLEKVRRHEYVRKDAAKTTVHDLLAQLVTHYTVTGKKSVRVVRAHMDAIAEKLGTVKACDVTLPILEDCVGEWQAAGKAPATIQKYLGTLRTAYTKGQDAKRVDIVPTFPRIVVKNARQGFCEWATFLKLLAALPDDGLRDFTEWAGRTAMRKGEIAALTWDGYDRETQVVRLHGKDAKTGQPRRIVLAGPLLELVARRVKARRLDCPHIFHRDGQPVREFPKSWATACKTAGAEWLRFHDLRRTAIRNMVRAGVSQHVAMAISGHRTDAIFRRYDITSDDDLRLAAERTAAYTDQLPTMPTVRQLSESDASRRHPTPRRVAKGA